MKKSISIILLSSFILNATSIDIDEIISKIKSIRESKVTKQELQKLESPIVEIPEKNLTKEDNKSKEPIPIQPVNLDVFTLKAIMNDKAYINNKWVGIGDKIGSYKVVDIMDDAVYLSNGKKSKTVFFQKSHQKLIQIINR